MAIMGTQGIAVATENEMTGVSGNIRSYTELKPGFSCGTIPLSLGERPEYQGGCSGNIGTPSRIESGAKIEAG